MMHPIAQSLSVHARRSCRLEPGGAIKDQRDRQQTPALHRVATLRRESTQIRCRMIPQRDLHRGAHLVLPPPGAANRRVGKSQPYFRGCGNPGVEGLDESQHPGRLVLVPSEALWQLDRLKIFDMTAQLQHGIERFRRRAVREVGGQFVPPLLKL